MGDDVITAQAAADFFLTSLGPDFSAELNRWGRDDIIPENLDVAIREATIYLESEKNATKMMEKNSGREIVQDHVWIRKLLWLPKRRFPQELTFVLIVRR